ncbi:nitroreductase/quinone reductase family protein, partial [Streptomyces sp. NPDC006386]|uniref:nitroreductase/quinone reductase family protein n=1 Tax=Streptomyces sp. NPDC006386 TaxID=3156762 RepID=UPI0033B58A14
MPLEGEYEPSPTRWVREQVELYESSGGTRGTTLQGSRMPVVVLTSRGARTGNRSGRGGLMSTLTEAPPPL